MQSCGISRSGRCSVYVSGSQRLGSGWRVFDLAGRPAHRWRVRARGALIVTAVPACAGGGRRDARRRSAAAADSAERRGRQGSRGAEAQRPFRASVVRRRPERSKAERQMEDKRRKARVVLGRGPPSDFFHLTSATSRLLLREQLGASRVFTASPDGEHGTREIDMHNGPAHPLVDRLFGPISDPSGARVLARELAWVCFWLVYSRRRSRLLPDGTRSRTRSLRDHRRPRLGHAGRLAAALALVAATGSAALSIATSRSRACERAEEHRSRSRRGLDRGRASSRRFAMHRLSRPAPP